MAGGALKFGDWLPDLPARDNPGVVLAENLLPHMVSYKPVRDLVESIAVLDSYCLGAAGVTDNAGVSYNYAGDINKLYRLSSGVYADVSKAGAPAYTVPDGNRWRFARFLTNMFAANGDDPIQVQIGFAGNFADIVHTGATPAPGAQHIAAVRSFLMAGRTLADKSIVQWCGQGNYTMWDAGTQQAGQQPLDRGGPITGILGGEYGVIFCEEAIYRVNYVGAPIVWEFDEVAPEHGTRCPGSIAQYGNLVYFIDDEGFHVFNGSVAAPIGSRKVNDFFLTDYDSSQCDKVVSAIDDRNNLVLWAYPNATSVGGRPNRMIAYDWVSKRFAGPIKLELEEIIIAPTEAAALLDDVIAANYPQYPALGLEVDLDGVPDLLDGPEFSGGSPVLGAFSQNHALSGFTGDVLAARLQSGEQALNPGGRSFVSGVRPVVDGAGAIVSVRVGARDDTFNAVNWTAPATPNARSRMANFRSDARYHRAEVTVSGEFDHLSGFEVEFEKSGEI